MGKHADISSIYDRGNYKRKGSHPKNDSTSALTKACTRFGARSTDVNVIKALKRGDRVHIDKCGGSTPEQFASEFNKFGRAVAALNNVKAFGEYYILPKRLEPDPANKFTIQQGRNQKSFVKPGEVVGFTVTRL